MSVLSLLLATRDKLREVEGLFDGRIANGPEILVTERPGSPPPSASDWFIGVWSGDYRDINPDINRGLDELCGITVTLSRRSALLPRDRVGDENYVKGLIGIEKCTRKIITTIHQSYPLLHRANSLGVELELMPSVSGVGENDLSVYPKYPEPNETYITGFYEPLTLAYGDPTPEYYDSLWNNPDATQPNPREWLVSNFTFTGARRTQDYTNME